MNNRGVKLGMSERNQLSLFRRREDTCVFLSEQIAVTGFGIWSIKKVLAPIL